MTREKMYKINNWVQHLNKKKLQMQDQLVLAAASMEMLEKIEPIYDKYNGGGGKKDGV